MPMAALPVRPPAPASDEMVVLQLLEEIHHLILPSASGVAPSALRLQAAAKLYLDTRDAFETIERNVEGTQHNRPKLLRKLSKRRSLGGTPRDSMVMTPTTQDTDTATAVASVSVAASPSAARGHGDAAYASGTLTARSEPQSRRASIAEDSPLEYDHVNDAVVDRIQDMFRHLGEKLSRAILDELRHRNVPIQTALHYVRFLPADSQWTAYMEKRDEEVRLAHHPQKLASETLLQQLKRNAEFIKEQIRRDVNMVCLFSADGTLSTIFGDDITTDAAVVAEKFEVLIRDVYAKYLFAIIDTKMDQLLRVSDQWQQDMAVMGASPVTADAPHAQLYVRSRKFRSKIPVFPHAITAIDERASVAVLPPAPSGHQVRVLVADLNHLGVWWQKTILAATDRDVTTVHTDEGRGLSGVNASLDGQIFVPLQFDSSSDFLRRYARHGGLTKWQGHRLLVNNGKDSLWVEATVVDVEDNKRCKLQLKKSIEKSPETLAWQQLLASHEWVAVKDLKLCIVPLNPSFRIHMGLKFRTMIDVFQSLVTEISSIFPNEDLEHRVGKALWQAMEPSVSRGEHIYARYFRSVLNQELQPKRPSNSYSQERSSSIVMASASVRNLVAALEHSALTNSTGAMGAASSSGSLSAPTTPSPQRRLSLSHASSTHLLGRVVDTACFDDKGVYHHQLVLPDAPMRLNAVSSRTSPFEKLAHHLLEEKEMIGACIQNNNIAIGRAFAQVLHEKLTRLTKQIQTRLAQDETSAFEVVVAEYANACRFLYTWHIVRYEIDTVGKQRRTKRDHANGIHAEWVDRSFHRMEALVDTMLRLQLQYLLRVFFHEFSSHTLPGICEQDWRASKPWFSHSRCTYALQFVFFRIQTVFDAVVLSLLAQYERALCVHEKMHDMASWLVVDLVACVASLYETMVVSRARLPQWKMDVLYVVVGVAKLLRLLEKMLAPKTAHAQQNGRGSKKPTIEIREICLRLLACLAVRCGPAIAVADEVVAKVESSSSSSSPSSTTVHVDAITEFEVHVTAIRAATGMHHAASTAIILDEEDTSSWVGHSVFGDLELKHLADVELNWASLIARSSLEPKALLASLRHRHELGDWQHPPLTDEQAKARVRLQECANRVVARLQQRQPHDHPDNSPDSERQSRNSKSPSRAATPDTTTGASFRRSSPSLQGPAVNGAEEQPTLLPNNPIRDQSEQAPPVARPPSTSTSKQHVPSDAPVAVQAPVPVAVAVAVTTVVPPAPDPPSSDGGDGGGDDPASTPPHSS